ncbi:MAG: beta-aspartyl-peptidase [Sneathiella sp.]
MITLLKNANLYQPEFRGLCDILLANGKIAAIENDLTITGLPGLTTIDAQKASVVPGFVDGHVHLIGGGGEGGFATRTPEVLLSDLVRGGVTTVVGLLGTDCTTRHTASLFAKTKALCLEGITAYMFTGGYAVPSPSATNSIGNDILFMDPVIGLKTAISDHRSSHPAPQELARMSSDARVAGLASGKAGSVVVHLGGGKNGFDLLGQVLKSTDIPIRQFIPTHVNRKEALFEEALHWVRKGGFIDLTAGINPERGAKGSVKTSEAIARCQTEKLDISRICVSSDANGSIPVFDEAGNLKGIGVAGFDPLLNELRDMITHEKIPLEFALVPFTSAPAQALGLSNHKGALKTGMDADLLILDSDMSITHMLAKGQLMMSDKEVLVKGTFEK